MTQQSGQSQQQEHTRVRVQEVSFSVQHTDTPQLAFGATPTVLAKGASKALAVRFAPSSPGPFHARIPIEVNGLYTVHVTVIATVFPRCVELAAKGQASVDLGAVRVGRTTRTTVELVNRTPVATSVNFAPSARLNDACAVTVEPAQLQLAARAKGAVTLTFKPRARLPQFKEALRASVAGVETALTVVTGAGAGPGGVAGHERAAVRHRRARFADDQGGAAAQHRCVARSLTSSGSSPLDCACAEPSE